MNEKCVGWFATLRCNFEPRYDQIGGMTKVDRVEASAEGIARIIDAAKRNVYVCDVCTACGEQVMRPSGGRIE